MIMQLRYRVIKDCGIFIIESNTNSYVYYIDELLFLPIMNKFGIDFTWWSYPINSISNFSYGIKIKKP